MPDRQPVNAGDDTIRSLLASAVLQGATEWHDVWVTDADQQPSERERYFKQADAILATPAWSQLLAALGTRIVPPAGGSDA